MYGEKPGYSQLIELVANSAAERTALLRGYFEPTETERPDGLKTPSIAHRMIARLVGAGRIRVIITTNFDRMIERAIEAQGITPTVIATPDAADGALPITHSKCTVIKAHGDYLDLRIKNTPVELSEFDPRIDRLLDRVLDEFGLIVCGWSAEWDPALRTAIERRRNRRFTTYWTARGDVGDHANRIVNLADAAVIPITDADSFFRDLFEKVSALEDLERPHPLPAEAAVSTVKRYLPDPQENIRLFDLVHDEAERVHTRLGPEAFPLRTPPFTDEEFRRRSARYEAGTESLRAVLVTGGFWGDESNCSLWTQTIQRIASQPVEDGLVVWSDLRLYPSLLLTYAAGLGALAAGKYEVFGAVVMEPTTQQSGRNEWLARSFFSGNMGKPGHLAES